MDQQQKSEMSKQTVLDFKCEKIISTTSEKPGEHVDNSLETKIVCETPQKISEPLLKKPVDIRVKLPDNYRIVAESFDSMNCSLKLLGLRKKLLTFENVSTQMEIMTKRSFSYKHLAQLKYILPEALQIDKILVHDKNTLLMKPDMKINILFDVVEGHSEVSDFVALSQLFTSRLYNFVTSHPEACDVPEAILPEPFDQRSPVSVPDDLDMDLRVKPQPSSIGTEISEKLSPNPYFKRHFSQNSAIDDKEKIGVPAPAVIPSVNNLSMVRDHLHVFSPTNRRDTKATLPENSPGIFSEPVAPDPQSQANQALQQSLGTSTTESPLPKPTASSDSFAVETPSQPTPKRSISSCGIIQEITSSHSLTQCTQSCKPAKRSLDFFQSEGDECGFDICGNELKYDRVVYRDISQVAEEVFKLEKSTGHLSELHDVRQMGESMCGNISSCLVGNVALIHSIFKSVNFVAITKDELVYKLLINSLDVMEKKEVEDQLELLEKSVPDWIYKEIHTCGDVVYNIKDDLDLDSIRAKLSSF